MGDEYNSPVMELCKRAQGNLTTIYWCKAQIRVQLMIIRKLVSRLATLEDNESRTVVREKINKHVAKCTEFGDKIKTEIMDLEAVRLEAKRLGIDIKTKLINDEN